MKSKTNIKKPNNKLPITKIVAMVLCMVTISLSWSIYSSYKKLYSIEDAPQNSVFYTALAQTPDTDSTISKAKDNTSALDSLKKPRNEKDIVDIQKNILLHILILLVSFIGLATIQNIAFNIESKNKIKNIKDHEIKNIYFNRKYNSTNSKLIYSLNSRKVNPKINSILSFKKDYSKSTNTSNSKEGVK